MEKYAKDYNLAELMAVAASQEVRDGENVFVGIGIPLMAGFLAMYTHAPNAKLISEGGYIGGRPVGACTSVADDALGFEAPYVTSLWRTFSDLQRGYFDLAMIGAAQVDRFGNVNSTAVFGEVGSYYKPSVRLTGSGGANDMASSADRTVIMIRLQKKRFPVQVDYVTSPGYIDGPEGRAKVGLRRGGPSAVITDKAILRFDNRSKEMYLDGVYPGVSVRDVQEQVSWDLRIAPDVKTIEPPTVRQIFFMRKFDPADITLRGRKEFEVMKFDVWARVMQDTWKTMVSGF